MKAIFAIFTIIMLLGLSNQSFGQNVSNDPEDLIIKDLIAECKQSIQDDDSLSDAEKTVYKRNCVTEITNQNRDVNNNHKLAAEYKVKVQDMQKCEDWYPHYKILTLEQFRIQKNQQVLANCLMMYEHKIWNYEGEDRIDVLVKTLDETKSQPQKSNSEKIIIPEWVRQNAGWWAQGQIDDYDFVSGIQYMIEQKWIRIPHIVTVSTLNSNEIPDWIRNNADWWSQGLISDDDFVNGLQHLIKENIIKIS